MATKNTVKTDEKHETCETGDGEDVFFWQKEIYLKQTIHVILFLWGGSSPLSGPSWGIKDQS